MLGDRGYNHDKYRRLAWALGVKPVIARRGVPHGSGLGTDRWVVERTFAHLHWFRRLRIRGEVRDDIHGAFLRLAREEPAASVLPMGQGLMAPQLNVDNEGKSTDDFVLRTGINLPMGDAAAWRPLSERSIDALAQALNVSALPGTLHNLGHAALDQSMGFRPLGHNRARTARLVWQAVGRTAVKHPVEAIVTVTLPQIYGPGSAAPVANITVDVVSRICR